MELMIQKMGLMTMRMIMFIMLYCYPLLCFICSTGSTARGLLQLASGNQVLASEREVIAKNRGACVTSH